MEGPALFTFMDGCVFRVADWSPGWITAEEVAIKLRGITNRNKKAVCHKRTDQEVLQLQVDTEAFGRFANQLGGNQPDETRLRIMEEAMSEIRNIVAVRKIASTPKESHGVKD